MYMKNNISSYTIYSFDLLPDHIFCMLQVVKARRAYNEWEEYSLDWRREEDLEREMHRVERVSPGGVKMFREQILHDARAAVDAVCYAQDASCFSRKRSFLTVGSA